MAILRWRDQHKCWLHPIQRSLARRSCRRKEKDAVRACIFKVLVGLRIDRCKKIIWACVQLTSCLVYIIVRECDP